jgi:hypothetical protein
MALSQNSSVTVPSFQSDEKIHRRKIAEWARQANSGKIPVVGNLVLATSTISTTVADGRVGPNSWIGLEPMTANALSAMPKVWVSSTLSGSFALTHASSASTDQNFRYAVLGT